LTLPEGVRVNAIPTGAVRESPPWHAIDALRGVDLDDNRLQLSTRFGATVGINNNDSKAVDRIMKMTDGRGVDTAIEAVGVPSTLITCEDIVARGGVIANIGVHGVKAHSHLKRLWNRNIAIATRLVDTVTTPMQLETVQSRRIDPSTNHASLQARQDHGCLRNVQCDSGPD
jgi:alcohol dehydrogenase